MRTDPRLQIITETLHRLIPGAAPAFMSVDVAETLPGSAQIRNTWRGTPAGLAEKIFTALYGRPGTRDERSPLEQADDAKRARHLGAEIAALRGSYSALTSAPWYPARPGDLVHVHYEAAGEVAAAGETYVLDEGRYEGTLSVRLVHCSAASGDEGLGGCFEVKDSDEPLTEMWFEAGPHRLTIIRDGRPVHIGGPR
ncbi:hypothetical protein AB0R01_14700 [Streptomyces rochei]|uniref:hypothetical protein n=1 Tax=Streptomyces rochei TaxID=1928 RepID=UPI00341A66A6